VTGGGLSDELLQATYSVGMKGVNPTDTIKVEELIQKTLSELAVTGFEDEAIKAAMNTFEFKLREFNTGSFPKGLSVMLGMNIDVSIHTLFTTLYILYIISFKMLSLITCIYIHDV
jgi:Zn-dependent M16 (insulinase) family peptidase